MIRDRVPLDIRKDVIDVLNFIQPRLPFCPPNQQTYLFKIYNLYFKPLYLPDIKENCGGCRSDILGKIKFAARLWKEQDGNL